MAFQRFYSYPKPLVEGVALPTAPETSPGQYIVPSDAIGTTVRKFNSYNSSNSDRTVTVYVVPAGASPAARYMLFSELVEAGRTYERDDVLTMKPGDYITATGSEAGVIMLRVSGAEVYV